MLYCCRNNEHVLLSAVPAIDSGVRRVSRHAANKKLLYPLGKRPLTYFVSNDCITFLV